MRTLFGLSRLNSRLIIRTVPSSRAHSIVMSRKQPPWQQPPPPTNGVQLPPLTIFNSLTKSKTPFVPLDPAGKKVTWYCCGPTVYDAGHLGHARNYLTTDILRRIMQDYFGYEIEFVMNVTDIDDKIILRARQNYLLEEYIKENPDPTKPEVVENVNSAYKAYLQSKLPAIPESTTPEEYESVSQKAYHAILQGGTLTGEGSPSDEEAKIKMHLNTINTASKGLIKAKAEPSLSAADFYAATEDILRPYLDSLKGHAIKSDNYEMFSKLTHYWEKAFREDLRRLDCLPPSFITRVTEFVPENIGFVEKIVKNGFGYVTSDGSVYFDVAAFEAAGNPYARLEPWSRNDKGLQSEGEGALTAKFNQDKKNPGDFVLWKASKPGEPSWSSPWGQGRPGWHIECSAMCSEVLGSQVDIHSGGIDLAYPHHDNELAQSEAYWTEPHSKAPKQWINYFLHIGHLSISGSKMSKSLKNFVSIKDALDRGGSWTSRGLRIVFLKGGWKEGIEITDAIRADSRAWEDTVNKFFANVRALLSEEEQRENETGLVKQLFRNEEAELVKEFDAARATTYAALCDSFNTPLVMVTIADLISKTNIYIAANQKTYISSSGLKEISRWITHILTVFGLNNSEAASDGGSKIGWSSVTSTNEGTTSGSAETVALPYVRVLSSFRDKVRKLAIENPSPASKELLKFCDEVRDADLVNLGVSLEDRDPTAQQPALVKFIPKEELIAAREEKLAIIADKARKKEAARLEKEKADRERLEKGKLDPKEMFRTDEYSEWDVDGLPIRDKAGEEVNKSRQKKLKKLWEGQKKLHDAWTASQAKSAS